MDRIQYLSPELSFSSYQQFALLGSLGLPGVCGLAAAPHDLVGLAFGVAAGEFVAEFGGDGFLADGIQDGVERAEDRDRRRDADDGEAQEERLKGDAEKCDQAEGQPEQRHHPAPRDPERVLAQLGVEEAGVDHAVAEGGEIELAELEQSGAERGADDGQREEQAEREHVERGDEAEERDVPDDVAEEAHANPVG